MSRQPQSHQLHHERREAGFTVIELMIATAVFTVVMMLLVFGVIQISRVYYKGLTASNTQNTARNVTDNITQSLQFNGAYTPLSNSDGTASTSTPGTNVSQGFCVGSQRYSYLSHHQLVKNTAAKDATHAFYVLMQDTDNNCTSGDKAQDLYTGAGITGTELLGVNMRIINLAIAPVSGSGKLYSVTISLAYGDDDLLCSPSASDCNASGTSTNLANTDLICKGQTGSQFCATSTLNTIVGRRL